MKSFRSQNKKIRNIENNKRLRKPIRMRRDSLDSKLTSPIKDNEKEINKQLSSPVGGDLVAGELLKSEKTSQGVYPQLFPNQAFNFPEDNNFPKRKEPPPSSTPSSIFNFVKFKKIKKSVNPVTVIAIDPLPVDAETVSDPSKITNRLSCQQLVFARFCYILETLVRWCRAFTLRILRIKSWHRIVMISTLICLFLDNIRLWILSPSLDAKIWLILFTGMMVLCLDLLFHFILIITNITCEFNYQNQHHHHHHHATKIVDKSDTSTSAPSFSFLPLASFSSPLKSFNSSSLSLHQTSKNPQTSTSTPVDSSMSSSSSSLALQINNKTQLSPPTSFNNPSPHRNKLIRSTTTESSMTSNGMLSPLKNLSHLTGNQSKSNTQKSNKKNKKSSSSYFIFGQKGPNEINNQDKNEILLFYFFMDLLALLSILLDTQCISTSNFTMFSTTEKEEGGGGWWCPIYEGDREHEETSFFVVSFIRVLRLVRFTRLLRTVGNFGQLHYGSTYHHLQNDELMSPESSNQSMLSNYSIFALCICSGAFMKSCYVMSKYCCFHSMNFLASFCNLKLTSASIKPDDDEVSALNNMTTHGGENGHNTSSSSSSSLSSRQLRRSPSSSTLDPTSVVTKQKQMNEKNGLTIDTTSSSLSKKQPQQHKNTDTSVSSMAWALSESTNRVTALMLVLVMLLAPCFMALLSVETKNSVWDGGYSGSGNRWWGSGWGGAGGGTSASGASGGSAGLHSTVLQALFRLNHAERLVFLDESDYLDHAEVLTLKIDDTYYIDRHKKIQRNRNFELFTIGLILSKNEEAEPLTRIEYGSDCASSNVSLNDDDDHCLAVVTLDISSAYSREGRNSLVYLLLIALSLWFISKISKRIAHKSLKPMEKILLDAKTVRSTLRRQLRQLGDRGLHRRSIGEDGGSFKSKVDGRDMAADIVDHLDGERLLQTVEKMADLLFIGFGDAGVEIVRRHLGFSEKDTVQVFVKGTKISGAMFGFCDIRDFTAATESLEEDVLMFVNLIGHVVHLNTSASGGFCNKNIGDAFFLVWKQEAAIGSSMVENHSTETNMTTQTAIHAKAALLALEKKKKIKKKKKLLRKVKKPSSSSHVPKTPPATPPNISRAPSSTDYTTHLKIQTGTRENSFSNLQDSSMNSSQSAQPVSSVSSTTPTSPNLSASKPSLMAKQNSRSLNQKSLLMVLGVDSGIANALEKRTPVNSVASPSNARKSLTTVDSPSLGVQEPDGIPSPLQDKVRNDGVESSMDGSLELYINDVGRIPSTSAWGAESGDQSYLDDYDNDGSNRELTLTRNFSLDDISIDGDISVAEDSLEGEKRASARQSPLYNEDRVRNKESSPTHDEVMAAAMNNSNSSRNLPPLRNGSSSGGDESLSSSSRTPPKRGNLTRGGAPGTTIEDFDHDSPIVIGRLNIKPFVEQQERHIVENELMTSSSSSSQHHQSKTVNSDTPFSFNKENRRNSQEEIINSLTNRGVGPKVVKVASNGSFRFDHQNTENESKSDGESDDEEEDDDDSDVSADLFNEFEDEDDDDNELDGPTPLPYFHPFEKLNSCKDPVIPFTLADLALKAMAQVAHDLDHLNAQTSGAALAQELIKLNVFQNQKEPEDKEFENNISPPRTPTKTPRSGPTSPIARTSSKKKTTTFFRSPPVEASVSYRSNSSSGTITPADGDDGSVNSLSRTTPGKSSLTNSMDSLTTSNSGGSSRRPSVAGVGDDRSMFEPVIGARPLPRRGMRRVSSAVIGSSSSFMVDTPTSPLNSLNETKNGVKLSTPKKPVTRGIRRVASAVMGGSTMDFAASLGGTNNLTNTTEQAKKSQPTSAGKNRPSSKGNSRPTSQRRRRRMSGARLGGGEKFGDSTSDGVKSMVASFRGLGKPVHLGYGLHCGWAIEGAVGSPLKIDATYLSPDVNIASRLESLTKTYGCDILLSEAFHEKLSPESATSCRYMDRVIVKGSSKPMNIYSYDRWTVFPTAWDHGNESTMKLARRLAHLVGKKASTRQKNTALAAAAALLKCDDDDEDDEQGEKNGCGDDGDDDEEEATKKAVATFIQSGLKREDWGGSCTQTVALSYLSPIPGTNIGRHGAFCFPTEYKRVFEQGIHYYITGKWNDATWILETCRSLCPSDRAPTVVLDYMTSQISVAKWKAEARKKIGTGLTNEGAPLDWRSCRELDIK